MHEILSGLPIKDWDCRIRSIRRKKYLFLSFWLLFVLN